ncbi:hypothetical protein JYG23_07770 [Sedimentibacter sp. zth1]|uniref:hypothetical protein n=1 Tax=Sedimentibacter sp. zth1 TaxID=2816908 RepID=UPI001A93300C|nr:hypothetical protein [Sedimentibacter sp. zth1]QSX07230.1 hypothetical protein JYG23_07770 [Sedimentibacter sp. zth1]
MNKLKKFKLLVLIMLFLFSLCSCRSDNKYSSQYVNVHSSIDDVYMNKTMFKTKEGFLKYTDDFINRASKYLNIDNLEWLRKKS